MTEVATTDAPSNELATVDEQALIAGAVGGIDSEDLVLPVIKPTQQLTREVVDGKVAGGHFYNVVTGQDYGDEMNFVVVGYSKGRFLVHNRDQEDERTYVASGSTAPDTWPQEYAGKAFVDIPDAEEQWKLAANAEGGEWGHGPPIVTTHNYVGFVLESPDIPARIGLSRTSAPTARTINTLMRFGGKAPWANAIALKTEAREVRGKPFYVVKASQGPQCPAEVVEQAKNLAYEVQKAGAFALDGAEVEDADKAKTAKPKAPAGGVSV
jgi:hypothetical protein